METKILLKNYIDVKDFYNLMEKNNILITKETKSKEGFIFFVKSNNLEEIMIETHLEEIMIETHMEWEFN